MGCVFMTIDRKISYVLILVIASLSLLTAVPPILPERIVEPFSELGILGPNMKLGDYVEEVGVGEAFSLFLYVGNHEGRVMYYRTLVKVGREADFASETDPMDAPVLAEFEHVILNKGNSTTPVNLSIDRPGINSRLVLELYKYDEGVNDFVYSGQWVQIWMNVTAPT